MARVTPRWFFILLLLLFAGQATSLAAEKRSPEARWYKGNTHTHSWWSDGDSPPELIVQWYKEHGYHFLVLSDHNILSEGEKWIVPTGARAKAAKTYEDTFDAAWIEKRTREGQTHYRCKPLNEFRALFEEAGRFLMIPGEEISDGFEKRPIHVNGINLKEVIPPPGGATLQETLQNNIDAVLEQRERTGRPMFPHVNHPNFRWALGPQDLMVLRGEQFFEVFNGHPVVANAGNETYVSTERMWDIILAKRLGDLDLPIMYGLATDDAHTYTTTGRSVANPGRGWIMVKSRYLTPEHLILALERGDFYASSGVTLRGIRFEDNTLHVAIDPDDGATYTTQFIGTMRDYTRRESSRHEDPKSVLQPKYSDEIGIILKEVKGINASYTLSGDELYVRARVISSRPHANPIDHFEKQMAWVQPVTPE